MDSIGRFGWKFYVIFYICLAVLPEIYDQIVTTAELQLSLVRIAFGLVFALPVAIYAFTEIRIPKSIMVVLFYVLAFAFIFELAGVRTELEDILVAIAILLLHLPGFVVLHRMKAESASLTNA